MPKQGSKSGKGARSNKTARVLSLLTDPEAVETEKAHGPAAAEKSAAPAQRTDDKAAQEQIRDALAMELTGQAPAAPAEQSAPPAAPQPAAVPAPAEPPRTRVEAAPAEQSAPTAAPQPAAVPAPAEPPRTRVEAAPAEQPAPPAAPQPAAVPAPAEPPRTRVEAAPAEQPAPVRAEASAPEEHQFVCVNITQSLVEAKADKYIKLFGMCTCERCRIDVIALALSNLPAKYVVAKNRDVVPLLSMYEAKYNAAVITQVMSACKKVVDHPRHE